MKFAYQAVDKSGKLVRGQSRGQGIIRGDGALRRQGLFVTEISEASAASVAGGRSRARIGRGKRLKCLAMFFPPASRAGGHRASRHSSLEHWSGR